MSSPWNFLKAFLSDSMLVTNREFANDCICHKALSISSAWSRTASTLFWASEAASFAALDLLMAAPARWLALSDLVTADPASLLAILADVSASPACCVTSASNWSLLLRRSLFLFRNWPFKYAISAPAQSSPATPRKIAIEATTSNTNLLFDGLSAGFIPIDPHSRHAAIPSRRSPTIAISSTINPTTTRPVNHGSAFSQCPDESSKGAIAFSSEDMALCRSEAELGRAEAIYIKCARV